MHDERKQRRRSSAGEVFEDLMASCASVRMVVVDHRGFVRSVEPATVWDAPVRRVKADGRGSMVVQVDAVYAKRRRRTLPGRDLVEFGYDM